MNWTPGQLCCQYVIGWSMRHAAATRISQLACMNQSAAVDTLDRTHRVWCQGPMLLVIVFMQIIYIRHDGAIVIVSPLYMILSVYISSCRHQLLQVFFYHN